MKWLVVSTMMVLGAGCAAGGAVADRQGDPEGGAPYDAGPAPAIDASSPDGGATPEADGDVPPDISDGGAVGLEGGGAPIDGDADAGSSGTVPDGGCFMTRPAAACGDGVCDPGCENALDCPADCPVPDGGIPCTDGPTTWTCNSNASARYECYHGTLQIDLCGDPGSCQPQPGSWPAQCHGCTPCGGWYGGKGLPYLYTCSSDRTVRRRCIDESTGADCIQGSSTTCCVVDDRCAGGACESRPEGTDDLCPS